MDHDQFQEWMSGVDRRRDSKCKVCCLGETEVIRGDGGVSHSFCGFTPAKSWIAPTRHESIAESIAEGDQEWLTPTRTRKSVGTGHIPVTIITVNEMAGTGFT